MFILYLWIRHTYTFKPVYVNIHQRHGGVFMCPQYTQTKAHTIWSPKAHFNLIVSPSQTPHDRVKNLAALPKAPPGSWTTGWGMERYLPATKLAWNSWQYSCLSEIYSALMRKPAAARVIIPFYSQRKGSLWLKFIQTNWLEQFTWWLQHWAL